MISPRLLILGCSATKRPNLEPMPAIDRYDGPIWRTLRARLEELPAAAAAAKSGQLAILVLSAEHGFIRAEQEIADYDRRLTRDRATWLSSAALVRFHDGRQLLRQKAHQAAEVLVVGGEIYRDCIARTLAVDGVGLSHCRALDAKTTWTRGAIGEHRQQLSAWLRKRFAA